MGNLAYQFIKGLGCQGFPVLREGIGNKLEFMFGSLKLVA